MQPSPKRAVLRQRENRHTAGVAGDPGGEAVVGDREEAAAGVAADVAGHEPAGGHPPGERQPSREGDTVIKSPSTSLDVRKYTDGYIAAVEHVHMNIST